MGGHVIPVRCDHGAKVKRKLVLLRRWHAVIFLLGLWQPATCWGATYCTRTKWVDTGNGFQRLCTTDYEPVTFVLHFGAGTTNGTYHVRNAAGTDIAVFNVSTSAAGSVSVGPFDFISHGDDMPDQHGAGTFNIKDCVAATIAGGGAYSVSGGSMLVGVQTSDINEHPIPGSCPTVTVGGLTMDYYINGASPCGSAINVTAHWTNGTPVKASVVLNVQVGGLLMQIGCDANGCNSGSLPPSQLTAANGNPPYTVTAGVNSKSWDYGSDMKLHVPTVGSAPSSATCGDSIDIALDSGIGLSSPTPTPSPSATVNPSPTVTPEPSPITYEPPPSNNPGTTVTNGGVTGSGISNQDIYNDVKQALDDAGTRDSNFLTPDGGFAYGSGPPGEGNSAGNGLQSAVDRFTGDLGGSNQGLMEKVDAIDSLDLPTTIGDKSSWAFTLPVLGEITIDLSTFDTPVWAFRSLCLAILVVGAWFAIVKIVRSGVA